MLPNHAPLVIAEQFGTLASLYPGRIDLGLGRAPGTDQRTSQALAPRPVRRRHISRRTCSSCRRFSGPLQPGQAVQAVPGTGLEVPLWILGSSLFGAQLAAVLGLPYAFASHFAPEALLQALDAYRQRFQASEQLAAALRHGVRERRCGGNRCRSPQAVHDRAAEFRPHDPRHPRPAAAAHRRHRGVLVSGREMQASRMLARSFVGSPDTVRAGLQAFVAETQVDELMITSALFDQSARLRSYEIVRDLAPALGEPLRQVA